jgi:hypothetical protein
METFFAGNLDKVLVGANASCFESLGGQLFVFVWRARQSFHPQYYTRGDVLETRWTQVGNSSTVARFLFENQFPFIHTIIYHRILEVFIPAKVVDTELRTAFQLEWLFCKRWGRRRNVLWHTTVEAGLRVWLVLAVAITSRWTTRHFFFTVDGPPSCCVVVGERREWRGRGPEVMLEVRRGDFRPAHNRLEINLSWTWSHSRYC